jgi:flavin reductase (DIM6/NTAB) family NADH-FMN oxidoreductase RutF
MSRISCRGFRPAVQRRCLSTTSEKTTRERLRLLLRETAQPVAVITSNLQSEHSPRHHGATLSSFTSIAMDPYPLVSFSLRIPSRMATALKFAESRLPSHMVINLLSAAQASTAVRFSRPDIYPKPFASIPYTLTEEGLPVLEGCLGALSCSLVEGSWPLHDLEFIEGHRRASEDRETVFEGNGVASELFLARVVRVETLPLIGDDLETLPLLYHRRGYTTTSDIVPRPLNHRP